MRLPGTLLVTFALLQAGCHGVWIRPSFSGPEHTVESTRFRIRSDLAEVTLEHMAACAEAMVDELEFTFPSLRSPGEQRSIVAFSDPGRFRTYLRAHLFAHEKAIGFFCDLGGECALCWSDAPQPEDLRVLRHELAHQHLALCLRESLPAWLEEGLVERLALGPFDRPLIAAIPPEGATAADDEEAGSWIRYRDHRLLVDAVYGTLELHADASSWPARSEHPADRVPAPSWAAGEGGYVLHTLFIRFLEAEGEGLEGALGDLLTRAARGEGTYLDLSDRFPTLGALEERFHAYVLEQGLRAVTSEAPEEDPLLREAARSRLIR